MCSFIVLYKVISWLVDYVQHAKMHERVYMKNTQSLTESTSGWHTKLQSYIKYRASHNLKILIFNAHKKKKKVKSLVTVIQVQKLVSVLSLMSAN